MKFRSLPALGAHGVAATSNAYYLAGTFDGQLELGGPTLTSAGKQDAFLVRLPQ